MWINLDRFRIKTFKYLLDSEIFSREDLLVSFIHIQHLIKTDYLSISGEDGFSFFLDLKWFNFTSYLKSTTILIDKYTISNLLLERKSYE